MAYEILTTMILAILAILAWSIMYKQNEGYRIAEDLTIGVMGGYLLSTLTDNTVSNFIKPLLNGELINIIPIVLGIMIWTQLSTDYRWIARTPLAFITGIGAAVAMKGAIYGNILVPIQIMSTPPGGNIWNMVNFIIAGIATITAVTYFFFTVEAKGPMRNVNQIGRLLMMLGFGSIAGSSVLSNTTFLYNRAQWFIETEYAWIPLILAFIVIAVDIFRKK